MPAGRGCKTNAVTDEIPQTGGAGRPASSPAGGSAGGPAATVTPAPVAPASPAAAGPAPAGGEGGLQAPTRHAMHWQNPAFYDETAVLDEMERVFDLCHGCRRCVSLCEAFPTLFDLVDESPTMEMDGVARDDYWRVTQQCYLCDLCYQTKCPYIPPHEWNIDFPHLMLRAKAVRHKKNGARLSEKVLASTDAVGAAATIPIVVNAVNAANRNATARKVLQKALGVHVDAAVPEYYGDTLRKRVRREGAAGADSSSAATVPVPAGRTRGKVALFTTCYANYNAPALGEDLLAVLRHNEIAVRLVEGEKCCAMPMLELGDLPAVARAKAANVPRLAALVEDGWDIVAPVPSCVLMFRQELPLLFAEDADVATVAAAMFDPFEYLMARHAAGLLKTDFKRELGKVAYHAACHQRVQKVGPQTRDCLALVPGTEVVSIERCSGHNGTYGVKAKSYAAAMKIVRPVVRRVKQSEADYYGSDCPMAGRFIEHGMEDGSVTRHPVSLLRMAYGV